MKKLVLLASFMLLSYTSAFAIADFGIYGGYSFAGSTSASDATISGPEYGVVAHYNSTIIPMVLSYGIGGYYQMANLTSTFSGFEKEYNKDTAGIDLYLQLELPIMIHPFAKASVAVYEKIEDEKEYFKSYAFGGGLAITVAPFVQLTGDYMYTTSKSGNNTMNGHAAHLGARINL